MKIWKYALLGLVSLSLISCLRGDGWEDDNRAKDVLSINLSSKTILCDGVDFIEVETIYNNEVVTIEDGVRFYTEDSQFVENVVNGNVESIVEGIIDVTDCFEQVEGKSQVRFKAAGTYRFWAEFENESTVNKPSEILAMNPGLYATILKDMIVADGVDSADIVVYNDAKLVTSGVTFKDMSGNSMDEFIHGMKFATTVVGEYTFYAEYNGKDTSDSPMYINAYKQEEEIIPEVGLYVKLSKTVIKADGVDSTEIKVYYDGEQVTDGVTFYTYPDNKEYDMPNFTYKTTTEGEFRFWVAYGTASNYKNPMIIKAVNLDIPTRPSDPHAGSINFVRRTLMMKFTGTGCGFCPLMTDRMHEVLDGCVDPSTGEEYPPYEDKVVVAEAHTYNISDPMYLKTRIDQAFAVSGYPSLVIDMRYTYGDYTNSKRLRDVIDASYSSSPAKAGISVNSELSGNTVVARVTIKAAANGNFRIGAFLLESGISSRQTVYEGATGMYDYDTHNNTIRVVDGAQSLTDYTGHDLGYLSAGNQADYVFAMNVQDGWVKDNCHLVFYVTYLEGGYYTVTNTIATSALDGTVRYEYIK